MAHEPDARIGASWFDYQLVGARMGKNGIHQAIRSAGATQRWFGLDMGNDVSAALNAVIGPGQEAILCQLEALIIRVISVEGEMASTMSSNSQNGDPAVLSLHEEVAVLALRLM